MDARVAHVFCLSNTNLHSVVSQVTRGRELEFGMTGTLRKLVLNRSCQLYCTSPSCQPQQGWWLTHFHTSLSFNSLQVKGTQFPLHFPLINPSCPFSFYDFSWADEPFVLRIPKEHFWEHSCFQELIISIAAPEKWRIHTVKLASGAEQVFD